MLRSRAAAPQLAPLLLLLASAATSALALRDLGQAWTSLFLQQQPEQLQPALVPGRRVRLGEVSAAPSSSHASYSTSAASASAPYADYGNASAYGAYEYLALSNVVGVQLAAMPGTNKFLLMERPSSRHPFKGHLNAGYIDVATRQWTDVECATSLENAAHSYLSNGTVVVLAGHKPQGGYPEGRKGIRVLDVATNKLRDVGSLQYGHWLATAVQLPTGQILVVSDSPSPVGPNSSSPVQNPFYELWDPSHPAGTQAFQLDKTFLRNTKYFYYPFTYVLPSGDVFLFANTYGQIIQPLTGRTVEEVPRWMGLNTRIMTAYPFGGSSVLLPLDPADNYTAEVMMFGGQWCDGWINTTGVDLSMRLSISYDIKTGAYSYGDGWQQETMPSPRLTFSSVLLPNGMVVLIGGAKAGLMGDSAKGGVAMANEPNLQPVLYNPKAAPGKRYSLLASGTIPRMLHSTAGLTTNGTILVAGCDRCDRFWTTETNVSRSPTGFPEYRLEIFNPPWVYDVRHRPTILTWSPVMRYGAISYISFSIPDAEATVTSAVLVAPSSDTHTFNMHQRVVRLEVVDVDTDTNHAVSNTVTVRGPPNANVAPPGVYLLFLLSGDTYGQAKWVTVKP